MVETRSGRKTHQKSSFLSTSTLLLTSILAALLAVSAGYVALDSVQHKTHSVLERGRYAFAGGDTNPSAYWQAIPSWEEVKGYATQGTQQALPEPSVWEQAKAFVTRKPVRQVQAEGAYATGKDKAANAADYAKQTADAAYDAAGEAKQQAQGVPDKIKKLFFGLKSKAEQEATRQNRIAAEAQWRAEYNSKQGFLQKLGHVLSGPSKSPTTKHYEDAKGSAGAAYDHAGTAAGEAYEAAKAAASATAAGARAAARGAQGAAASAGDVGSRTAASASETYDSTKDAAKEYTGTAQEYAQAGIDKSADAAAAAKAKADAAYQAAADAARRASGQAGVTAEEAAHRAQETAQQAKHRAQETYHQATA